MLSQRFRFLKNIAQGPHQRKKMTRRRDTIRRFGPGLGTGILDAPTVGTRISSCDSIVKGFLPPRAGPRRPGPKVHDGIVRRPGSRPALSAGPFEPAGIPTQAHWSPIPPYGRFTAASGFAARTICRRLSRRLSAPERTHTTGLLG